MNEFDHPDMDPSKDPDPIKKIRTKEPQAPFGSCLLYTSPSPRDS